MGVLLRAGHPTLFGRWAWMAMPGPVRSALKRTHIEDFNYFPIMFYYIITTKYQKIGELFCPVHISGLLHSVGSKRVFCHIYFKYQTQSIMDYFCPYCFFQYYIDFPLFRHLNCLKKHRIFSYVKLSFSGEATKMWRNFTYLIFKFLQFILCWFSHKILWQDFGFFLTTYPPALTFSTVWSTYLPLLVNVICERPLILLRTGLLQTIFHHLSFVVAIASWFSLAWSWRNPDRQKL